MIKWFLLVFSIIFTNIINVFANESNSFQNICPGGAQNLIIVLQDKVICPGGNAVLDAGYPGCSYAWSTGQTSQTITVTAAGNYSVTVTDMNGCTGTGQAIVKSGGAGLKNNSSVVSTCPGHYATIDAGNPGNRYLWSRGDTTQTIRVVNAGNYNVIITDVDECSISFSSTLIVNPQPSVVFTFPPICANDTVDFSSDISIASGNLSHYLWYFGDGGGSYSANPSHHYNSPGTYTVKLTVTSDSGCIGNFTTTARVNAIPLASFIPEPNCFGDTTEFQELSTVLNDSVTSWIWDFGDGTHSSQPYKSHLYSSPGTYQVQLIAGSSNNCYDTITKSVTVYSLPDAFAGPDTTICSGKSVKLGTSYQSGISYQWEPSQNIDNSDSSEIIFSELNNSFDIKEYIFSLTSINQFGCINTDIVTIHLLPSPEITFTVPSPQCDLGNQFYFSPKGDLDGNFNLNWRFGNEAFPPSSLNNYPPLVHYLSAGKHPVLLTYSYLSCPEKTFSDTVTVLKSPQSGIISTDHDGCAPLTISFSRTHHDDGNQYIWQIDGQQISGTDPVWTFQNPGSYIVSLDATNELGCSSLTTISAITVHSNPIADFSSSPFQTDINNPLIEFTNNSINAISNKWNFGDGSTANFFSGSHQYGDTGIYEVSLFVTSIHGCSDTVRGTVKIEEGFSFYVPNAFTPNGDNVNDSFQGYGTYIHSYEMWIFNRWGEQIYYTDEYNKPWDGHINSVVQNDTYVYRIIVSDSRQKNHVFTGGVTLVK